MANRPKIVESGQLEKMRYWGHGTFHLDEERNDRNKRTVWTIPTQPFPEAHFATFPEDLVIPCIMAGTSEKGNCSVCGKPWVRMVEKGKLIANAPQYKPRGKMHNGMIKDAMTPSGSKQGHPNFHYENKTIGWQPSCTCNADIEKPIVLDPFMGSGTVAVVCEKYGRGWMGIELSEDYCEIAKRRVMKEAVQLKL